MVSIGHPPGRHALTISITDAGPNGHGGVVAFGGRFDGSTFVASEPSLQLLDHGPDFYACQTFGNTPRAPVALAWMNSWHYANTVPSRGRRGVMTCPRFLGIGAGGIVRQQPAVPTAAPRQPVPTLLDSRADHAVEVRVVGSGRIEIIGDSGTAGTIEILVDLIRLRRTAAGSAVTPGPFEAHRQTGRPVVVLIDHGTVEIFAGSGDTVLTAQIFAGPNWRLVAESIDSIALL